MAQPEMCHNASTGMEMLGPTRYEFGDGGGNGRVNRQDVGEVGAGQGEPERSGMGEGWEEAG